jgi:Uncharacterized protein conserved in bacteria (DUF2188)
MPKHGPNVWVVRRRGAFTVREEGIPFYLTQPIPQRNAIAIARLIARANHSELIVQDHLGRIRARDSHGLDSPYKKG